MLINALKEIVNELDKSLAHMQETFCDIFQDKYQIQQSLLQRDAALLRELQSSTIQEKQKKQIAIAEQIACYNAISLILQRLVK
ncbi:MAG: hypothetical protein SPF53_06400 [Helicobacter trogontum]|uniref:hypothetical protein n=1 Tax=Helicobacter trogontum TaxID=50960 RepID=UPI00051DA76B|nr:hypothetical protein [Helicobacter trogontum]MDY5185519.1 hypothetical protein [Helicobacter trogontum]